MHSLVGSIGCGDVLVRGILGGIQKRPEPLQPVQQIPRHHDGVRIVVWGTPVLESCTPEGQGFWFRVSQIWGFIE